MHHIRLDHTRWLDNYCGFSLNLSRILQLQLMFRCICLFTSDVCGCWCFTSLIPVTRGPCATISSHYQKSISHPQDNTVNKVPWESGAVSNSFNSVSGLEPGSPAAPRGPISVFNLAAFEVTRSSLFGRGHVGELVVPWLSYQTYL